MSTKAKSDPKNDSREQSSSTDRGYDEAAETGESRYGVVSGSGGVFGTTGGGTSGKGMQVEERPMPYVYREEDEKEPEE
jgi:hypothetical protein